MEGNMHGQKGGKSRETQHPPNTSRHLDANETVCQQRQMEAGLGSQAEPRLNLKLQALVCRHEAAMRWEVLVLDEDFLTNKHKRRSDSSSSHST
jgi:hypothetical protein